jgi:hypothetical protein
MKGTVLAHAVEVFAIATLEKMGAELDKLPENQRTPYLVRASATRLFRLIQINAPECVIEAERLLLLKRAGELPRYE